MSCSPHVLDDWTDGIDGKMDRWNGQVITEMVMNAIVKCSCQQGQFGIEKKQLKAGYAIRNRAKNTELPECRKDSDKQ